MATSTINVRSILNTIPKELDKQEKIIGIAGVWNTSRELLNDIEELKAELAANHQGKKREGYWKIFAQKNLVAK